MKGGNDKGVGVVGNMLFVFVKGKLSIRLFR